jgi:hypothetical protein
MVLTLMATVAAIVYGNGNVIIAISPAVLAIALGVLWFAPMRIPVLTVVFLSLALDATDDGPWNSPLARLGSLLAINLNKTLPLQALAIPGVVVIFGLLFAVHTHRTLRRVQTDNLGRVPVASVSTLSIAASIVAVLGLCAVGAKAGGDMQMAKIQVQTFVFVLLFAYLVGRAMRGVGDYRVMGGVILAAACIKSVYAIYVIKVVRPVFESMNGAYSTTHGDSMLFAAGTVILIVWFAERPSLRAGVCCAALLPLLALGMFYNYRRLVWVEVAAALLLYWVTSRRSKVKRFVMYVMIASLPLGVGYIAAGWNSSARIFAPVRTFRSVGDSEYDSSTLYRDLENYNLLATLRVNMLLGTGFGHPFNEEVTLPSIANVFKEYRYMPHNSLLGLWAYTGAFGFSGLMSAIVVALYLAARSYRLARGPDERIVSFMAMGMIVIYLVHCWGDIGFSERKGIFLLAPALAAAGQLAVATGAWRARARAVTRVRG